MRDVLLVAAGGALGSVLRWAATMGVAQWTRAPMFPWGTLCVNVAGSFAIGLLLGPTPDREFLSTPARLLIVTGVLGGFTTFSAFSWETLALFRSGQAWGAAGYVAGSVAGGFAAAAAGSWLSQRFLA